MNKPNEKNVVFLSHSSKDKKQLIPFKKALEEKTNGTIQFFLSSDGQSIPFGHNWVASVEHSLDDAKLAFLLLTPNSLDSTWVAFEAGFMHAKQIRVIPVALPGIDLGQVPPPIGLLQGFNMHSHDAMNNIFEILNKEFEHRHNATFSREDFDQMFGAKSAFGSGFFSEYNAFVESVTFDGKIVNQSLIKTLDEELAKDGLKLAHAIASNDKNSFFADCPGLALRKDEQSGWFKLELHRDMLAILLPKVCPILAKYTKPQQESYNATVSFIKGVEGGDIDVGITARAYGTEFQVHPNSYLSFRKISMSFGIGNPLTLESVDPYSHHDIRELIIGLFESGILEFNPPKQVDPMLTKLANEIANLRRTSRY